MPTAPILAASIVDKLFPGAKVFGISASISFSIPGYKHVRRLWVSLWWSF
jgi:hypothetical protein